jgi:hypothetical protein
MRDGGAENLRCVARMTTDFVVRLRMRGRITVGLVLLLGATLSARPQSFAVLGDKGRAYVAFWLYDTGCEPLGISTALLGQEDPTRRVASIPFHCGE